MNRKLAPLFILTLSFVNACGGGSSSVGGNGGSGGGGTTAQPISVTFPAGIPPATLNAAQQTPLEANVVNDSANAGVTWKCTPVGACGSFSVTSTSSGNPTTYTAPLGVSAANSVTVTATSVTDPTKSASASITITAISIQFSQAPPSIIALAGTASVAASVANDSANAGVTWSCTPAGSCGSFSATTTPSGTTTNYTAPSAVPSGGSVTITATSVTDSSKSVQASVSLTSTITVSLSQSPPTTLPTSSTAPVTATVANDSTNQGVSWSCAPAGSCGSFSPTSTASGTATTYTPPSAAPSGPVTITANSISDPSKSVSANTVITGVASVAMLKGRYAFVVGSPTGNRNIATWIGSVNLDGAGNILGGIEEIASPIYLNDVADPILSACPGTGGPASGYTVDATGHGRLIMCTQVGETLGMSFVLTSSSHAEIVEADGFPSEGNPGSGTLDLQTPTGKGSFSATQISGSYSLTMTGVDETSKAHLSFGGFFSADGNSNITAGQVDINSGTGVEADTVSPTNAAVGAPDSNGRGVLRLPVFSPGVARQFVYYIVNSKVIRLIEADGNADMGGSAYIQPSTATGLGQNYVYLYAGWSSAGRTVTSGQFATSSGSLSGTSDSSAGPTPSFTAAHGPVSGSYAASTESATFNVTNFVDASGAGKTFNAYFVDPSVNILDPNNTSGGGGALLLETDSSVNGTGILLPQTAPAPFVGNYALNLNNSIAASTPNELDLVGVLAADGVSSFGSSNSADYDENSATANPMLNAPLSGSFAADASHHGRYTGSFTVAPPTGGTPYPFIPGVNPSTFSVSLYQAGPSQAFIVQNNATASIIGRILFQQLP